MAKQKTLEEIQNKINLLSSEKLEILEYNGFRRSCKIRCNSCGKIYTYTQYGNFENRLKRHVGICKDCFCIPKKKKAFEQSLQDLFPGEYIEIIDYTGNTKPCTYKCSKCGEVFTVAHAKTLKGKQHLCKKCFPMRYQEVEKQKKEFIDFIEKSNKWELIDDLSNINGSTQVACKCKQCGAVTSKTMYLYLKGIGCIVCDGNKKKTTEEFKQELDNDYELLSEYINNKTHVLLKHKSCGFCYKVVPDAYVNQGQRCPRCRRKQTKGERAIANFLKKHNIEYFSEFPVVINGHNLRFDFYIPSYDLYIEFQGIQHYEPNHFSSSEKQFKQQQQNDNRKRKYCGEKLIEIKYDELDNVEDILSKYFISSTTIPKGSTSQAIGDGNESLS